MKQIFLILILGSLFACHCPKCVTKTETHDSLIVKIIPHDTIIYAKGENIFIHDSVPCPQLNYQKTVTKNHLISSVIIKNGKITVDCKEDSLIAVIAHLQDKIIISSHSEKETNIQTKYKEHWWVKYLIGWFFISVPSLAVYLWLKFKP